MAKRREPVFNVPGPVLALLLLLAGIHVIRQVLPGDLDQRVVELLAFVPIRATALLDPQGVAARLASWAAATGVAVESSQVAPLLLRKVALPALPGLLTYALLHGGWAHLGLNGIWLLAFGTPAARRFGPLRFLLFVCSAAIAGSLTHWALFPFSPEPLIGASAAVSGCMGAALRFAFRDRAEASEAEPEPATLLTTLRDRRALSFLVAWFLSNALFGFGSVSFGLSDQPVAWQAHIGGFMAGLLLFPCFDRKRAGVSTTPGEPIEPSP